MILCSDISQENGYNEDDFIAFCEQSQYAWHESSIGKLITTVQLKNELLKEYAEFIIYS